MGWNEPDKDQDPWSGRNRQQGPPNLDELISRFFKKITARFKSNNSAGSGPSGHNQLVGGSLIVGIIAAIFLVIWIAAGIYIVDPMEQGVVLRFGQYNETVGPGPHWLPRFIDEVTLVNTNKVYNFTLSSNMLTNNANIIFVSIAVQYQIINAQDYLYSNADPDETLKRAASSALRQVIGHSDIDAIMTTGRSLVRQQVQELLIKILAQYNLGVEIKDVSMQPARAPDEVKSAFDEAIRAQEKEQQIINEATAYAKSVIPIAQGDAKRVIAEAEAYKQQVILTAQGDIARFSAVLPEYKRAPDLMRERMYMDTFEFVFSRVTKVLIDTRGNSIINLPLDTLLKNSANAAENSDNDAVTDNKANNNLAMSLLGTVKVDDNADIANRALENRNRDSYSSREVDQ